MSPFKILVTNQKGGVGKSTIAANLAGYLNIRQSLDVALIDFDRQGSSVGIVQKTPGGSVQSHRAGLTYRQSSGLTLLEAKAALRNCSKDVDLVVADLTWTFGLIDDFLLEFDLIIVPSSSSKIEIASTEIFILEYFQKNSAKILAKRQHIVVAPSRIERVQEAAIEFKGLHILSSCSIAPAIYRIDNINQYLYKSFFSESDDLSLAANFSRFCGYIASKIELQRTTQIALRIQSDLRLAVGSSPGHLSNIEPAVSVAAAKKITAPTSIHARRYDFIPAFLRKK